MAANQDREDDQEFSQLDEEGDRKEAKEKRISQEESLGRILEAAEELARHDEFAIAKEFEESVILKTPTRKTVHAIQIVGPHSDRIIEKISRHQLIYSILGLILGLVSIVGGIVLFLAGITGKMSWTAKFLTATSELFDAAPGAVLFVVGLFMVFITRYKFKSKR